MNDRLAWFGMMWLALACCRCTNDDAHAATRPAPKVDGGTRHEVRAVADAGRAASPAKAKAKSGADAGASSDATSPDALIGLTRAQLMVRRGPPTEKRGVEWVYTPDQPGCREMIAITAGLPFARPRLRVSSTESVTVAISARRTPALLR